MMLTLIAACFAGMAALPPQSVAPPVSVYARAQATTHILHEVDLVMGATKCSATAIGPHALLTASHCEHPFDLIMVDSETMRVSVHPMRDNLDHTIYIVDGTFPVWAKFATEPPQQGDEFFYFGNPGKDTGYLRKGYIAGFDPTQLSENQIVLDVNGYYGDSGAALFNTKGEIIAVFSQLQTQHDDNNAAKFCYAWPFNFAQVQLDRAAQ
jgi:hypothetical protein